jgi:hypothetical protein
MRDYHMIVCDSSHIEKIEKVVRRIHVKNFSRILKQKSFFQDRVLWGGFSGVARGPGLFEPGVKKIFCGFFFKKSVE